LSVSFDQSVRSFQHFLQLLLTEEGNAISEDISFSQLHSLITLLHETLNLILEDEYLSFPTLRSQFIYLSNKEKYSPYITKNLILLLDFYYQHRLPDQSQLIRIITALYFLIRHDSPEIPDLPIPFFSKALVEYSNNQDSKPDNNELFTFNAELHSIEISQTRYQTPLLKIKGKSEFFGGQDINIYMWDIDFKGNTLPFEKQFHRLSEYFFTGCTVRFFNMRYYQAEDAYIQTGQSIFVFMPDYLMDASVIGECYGNTLLPETWLLRLFDSNEFSLPLLQGQIINQILDNMINTNDEDYLATIWQSLQQNVLKILCLQDINVQSLIDNIEKRHLPNLYRLMTEIQGKIAITEPSFISPEYGIQGRLDALIEEKDKPLYKSIFELKSGKAPNSGTWKNHTAQVICYDLLLRSVFGKEREGHSMIFYSCAVKDPLRNVLISRIETERILMLRNQLVSYIYKIASDETDFTELLKKTINSFPPWNQERIQSMLSVVRQSSPIEQLYFKTFTAYMLREMINSKTGKHEDLYDYGFSALWAQDLSVKEKSGTVFSELIWEKKDQNSLMFRVNPHKVSMNFRDGDPVVLYGINQGVKSPCYTFLIKASFQSCYANHVRIQMRNDWQKESYFETFDYFILEKDNLEFSHYALINSLYDFLKATPRQKQSILGQIAPVSSVADKDLSGDKAHQIIQKAMAAEDYFIIQGPPGTGKTSKVIIGLIHELIAKDNLPIVILAFTNKAVEEIIDRLRQNQIAFIRLGSRNTNDKSHISHILDVQKPEESIRNLKTQRVFVSTVSTFHNEGHFLLQLIPKGTLIVDEASQLLEPHLAGLCVRFDKWILIGDHFQLPAVTGDNKVNVPEELTESIGLSRLNESLFERMIRICQQNGWDHAWDILTEHYRMHDEIAGLINHYYDNRLKSGSINQQASECFNIKSDHQPDLFRKRTLFIPCKASARMKINPDEARLIVSLIAQYEAEGILDQFSLGVICFWKAQCNLIQHLLKEKEINREIMVDTVERYQGSEKDIIIVSTALSKKSDLEIVSLQTHDQKVDRKLNVAVSRARQQFILTGDPKILNYSPHYRHLLSLLSLYLMDQ